MVDLSPPPRRPMAMGVFTFVLALLLLSPRLEHGSLRHWDEAWYADVSREIVQRNDWLTLHWNDTPWFHKPPLSFWGTAVCYRLFGISNVTARLFSLLCGAATVGLLAGFATRYRSGGTGLLAALVLLSCPEFCRYSGRGQLDAPLALFLTLQLIAFLRGLEAPAWHLVGGVAFGLALMTKGAAAALALCIQASFMLLQRDFRPLRQATWWGGLLLGLALAAPWHVQQLWQHGSLFLREYGSRHFSQFFVNIYPELPEPTAPDRWYYLEFLVLRDIPAGSILLGVLLIGGWCAWRSSDPLLRLAWCWGTIPLIGLSLARTKWSWYLVPIYPGVALLAALEIEHWAGTVARRRLCYGLVALGLAVVTAEPFLVPGNRNYEGEIETLAAKVDESIPPTSYLHTLQLRKASQSVYPIAVRFYTRRQVHATHSFEQLGQVIEQARDPIYLFAHRSAVEWLRQLGSMARNSGDFRVVPMAEAGPIVVLRIERGAREENLKGNPTSSPSG